MTGLQLSLLRSAQMRCSALLSAFLSAFLSAQLLLGSSVLSGCTADSSLYLDSERLVLEPSVPANFDDGEVSWFEVRREIPFPLLPPTSEEEAQLARNPTPPWERSPWMTRDQLEVRLDWTVVNLEDQPQTVQVFVDPWNEFARYSSDRSPEGKPPGASGIQFTLDLAGAHSGAAFRRHGTLPEERMAELAQDLATIVNTTDGGSRSLATGEGIGGGSLVGRIFAAQSVRDPLVREFIPATIPALTGIEVGLRSTRPGSAVLEVSVELHAYGDRKLGRLGDLSHFSRPDRVLREPQ